MDAEKPSQPSWIVTIAAFLKWEALGGVILIIASVLALCLANSPWRQIYFDFFDTTFFIGFNGWSLDKPLLLWINDGLMAIFFLLIGVELKREVVEGQLSHPSQIILPGVAALGGILVPALIYSYFNQDNPMTLRGWAIPTATDIAFALCMLSLLGRRVPQGLKIFLMSVTIFDDISAIVLIALFYTTHLSWLALMSALMAIVLLVLLNRMRIGALSVYGVVGFFLWACVLKSGVHATLAGFILALTIPTKTPSSEDSPSHRLELQLLPWVTYGILPLFAFGNAGLYFPGISVADWMNPLTLGIAFGLVLGKPLGIFSFSWILVKCGWASLPDQVRWGHILGIAILCGIGFTMSLFLSTLAFEGQPANMLLSRLGIFGGTMISALIGWIVLWWVLR